MSSLNQLYLACIIIVAIQAIISVITLKVIYHLTKRALDEVERMNASLEKIADNFHLEECEELR